MPRAWAEGRKLYASATGDPLLQSRICETGIATNFQIPGAAVMVHRPWTSVLCCCWYTSPLDISPPPHHVLAPLSQCAWVSCSLFDPSDSKWCAGARLLGSVSLNGYIYNFMVILTAVNDSGRKKPTRRVALAGWVGLQGRGVGYGWCESSLESTLTQHPHQSPRPPGNKKIS